MAEDSTGRMNGKPADREKYMTMKEWLFSKLQIPYNEMDTGRVNDKNEDRTEDVQSGNVPSIVISRGSSKSINNLINTPVIHKKLSLARSESYCTTTHGTNLTKDPAHPYNGSSPRRPVDSTQTRRVTGESDRPASETNQTRVQSSPSNNSRTFMSLSPVFRFSLRNNLAANTSSFNHRTADARWNDDAKDTTRRNDAKDKTRRNDAKDKTRRNGAKVIHSSSLPLVDHDESYNKVTDLPVRAQSQQGPSRKLDFRRTSSCGTPINRSQNRDRFSKPLFHSEEHFPRKTCHSEKLKRTRKIGSAESSRSTISLTRSISISLGLFKANKPNKPMAKRNLSLVNTDEFNRVYERRRSSLLRLFSCSANPDDADNTSLHTNSASTIADLDGTVSPKVTRQLFIGSFKRSGSPFDNFRSTFESEVRDVPTAYGQVKLMFQYLSCKKQLQVTILRGCNLASETRGTLGIYSTICMLPGKKQKQRSRIRHNTHDPTFQDLFCFRLTLDEVLEGQLKIKFYDKPGIFSWPIPIGECHVELYSYDLTASTVIWKNLNRSKGQKRQHDDFNFTLIEKGKEDEVENCPRSILTACACIRKDGDSVN